jgi:predicted phosphodiesterase
MTLTTDHGSIYMSHYPEDADQAAATGMHTLCIHGHTHKKRHEQKGTTTIINPGEICGAKTGEATCAVFDSETGHHGFFVLN